MSILTADDLSLSFGACDLFRGLSAAIANDSKIGLIGPNGVGKTSLLLILAGINPPTSGQVRIARGRRLGYLRQEAVDAFADRENTVYGEMLTAFAHLQARQERLHALEAQMARGDYGEELLAEYGALQQAFEGAGGYDYDVQIQRTLAGLGLGKQHWHTPLSHLSGGQKTRALLARLLLERPDLLLLDEPTNHLDLEAVEWLEKTLHEWTGAALIVSHDRYFLDNTVTTIWEMTPVGIQVYPGNYSAYLVQRLERWEYHQRVFAEEKERLLKEVDYVQRNWVRASTHAQALGRLRRLTRELAIVDSYGIEALRSGRKWSEYDADTVRGTERPLDVIEAIRQVNAIQPSLQRPPALRPRLVQAQPSGNIVLRADAATVGYPGHPLFTVSDLLLRRGDCAVLIGPNGAGKTTFLKVLLGQIQPLAGRVALGASLKIGYFAQAHDSLTGDQTVLDALGQHAPTLLEEAARNHLARYLFRGDDVFKPLGALSGGERARLALAILALDGANFLLLDEPTNHLDIPAREALQEVLEAFDGTILLVSHDRYLIDRLATQIWELAAGRLRVFEGTYRAYILQRPAAGGGAGTPASVPAHRTILAPKPMVRDNSRETRRRAETMAMVEARIREQEAAVQNLSAAIERAGQAQAAGDRQAFEQLQKLSWQMAQTLARLESLMAEWERLAA